MRLKKLIIHGFKSFADRTVLEFDEGITAIVGPNGCGKSNISDAFRWVLGEQSAKSMRGQKMGDIIFAGTSTRSPLNFAEVTLVFTDVGDALPIDFEEVSVTRRLHRSGESQYLINRNPVRLRDVQSLFLDSGIGKHSFAFFEQGKIDQVINLGPNERRGIFEKAAGILRFLQRKDEALRKLEQVGDNVNRVEDIHEEVAAQLSLLEKQAEEARIYKSAKEDLQRLELGLAVAKWSQLKEELSALQGEEEQYTAELDKTRTLRLTLHCQLQDTKKELEEAEQNFRSQQEQLFEQRKAQALKAKEKETSLERQKETEERKARISKDLREMGLQRAEGRGTYERAVAERATVEAQFEVAESAYLQSREELQELEEAVVLKRSEAQEAQNQRVVLMREESRLQSETQEKQLRLESGQEKLDTLDALTSDLRSRLESLGTEEKARRSKWEECSTLVDSHKAELLKLEEGVVKLKEEIKSEQGALESLLEKRADVTARERALRSLKEEHEGVSKGTQQLLRAGTDAAGPLSGKVHGLYERLEALSGAEKLLATALHSYQETLVVKSEEDFAAVLAYAEAHNIKDFSILCEERLVHEGGGGEEKWAPLLEKVLPSALARGFLKRVYCASSLEEALSGFTEGAELVTPKGVRVDHRGVTFFVAEGQSSVFLREAELKSLNIKRKDIEAQFTSLEAAIEALEDDRCRSEEQFRESDRALRQGEMRLVEANFSLQGVKQERKDAEQKYEALITERESLSVTLRQLSSDLAELESLRQRSVSQARSTQDGVERMEAELSRWEAEQKDKRETFQDKQAAFDEWKQKRQTLAHQIELYAMQERERERQEERLQGELDGLEALEQQVNSEDGDCDRALEMLNVDVQRAEALYASVETELRALRAQIEHVENNAERVALCLKEWEDKLHKVGVKMAQKRSSLDGITQELQDRHGLGEDLINTDDYPLDVSVDCAEGQVKQLRRRLEDHSEVNLAAIEECERYRSRDQFLQQQLGDLNASRDDLLQVISTMEEESRKVFGGVFAQIRENFQRNFGILFRGGEADLRFVGEDDILKAGIEITAKPPGKQMRSIQLLSGGEKCLTAVALLFSIFEVKHAPFCVLDEIDAPLDDSNIERFVSIVKQFIDRSQFVIITHNKRTMAIADRILGVTMAEPGASKILSISFQPEAMSEEERVLIEQVS